MVIVVLGHEKRKVDQSHGLFEAGMECRQFNVVITNGLESIDEIDPELSEGGQDYARPVSVVIRIVRFPIGQVGIPQSHFAADDILDAADPEFFEIHQMADVFLD